MSKFPKTIWHSHHKTQLVTHFINRVKFFTILGLITLTPVLGNGYSQNITMHKNNATLKTIFKEIEKQSNHFFLYDKNEVPLELRISISLDDQPLGEALNRIFQDLPLAYKIFDKNIVVRKKNFSPPSNLKVPSSQLIKPAVNRMVSGIVIDENGEGLPGVSILVKGTQRGMITDVEGRFLIEVPDESSVLIFSFVGYMTQEIMVGNRSTIEVKMEVDRKSLEEVVVMGYGTVERRHLTGSAGSIKMDEVLSSRPVVDFGQAMYGKIPGVQVLNTSGRPGQSSRVQIRGVTSISAGTTPLIVVDGVPLPNFDLNSVNSADIQSIDVLKDAASAAIYGSRGANGVILVTTKSGSPQRRSLSINYQTSLQKALRTIEVMNSEEYAQASIDAAQIGWIRSGGDPNAPTTLAARGQLKYTWPTALEHPETLPDMDWQDIILRTAPMHKADVSLTGGDKDTQYYLSFGFVAQEGIVISTDYNRLNLNLNLSTRVNNWLKIGGMINAIYDKENATNIHVLTANQYPPIYPLYGEDGYLGGPQNLTGFEPWNNILFRASFGHPYYRLGEIDEIQSMRGIANIFAEISLTPELKLKSSVRGFYRRNDRRYYEDTDVELGPGGQRQARYVSTMGRTSNITTENLLTYNKNFDGHSFDAVLGYEFNQRNFYSTEGERRNYDHDLTPYLAAGSLIFGATDQANESALISMLGRINYNYKDRYMLSVAFRRDGSSRFGPGNKWGNFPAFSAGWNIAEESFFASLKEINKLTFRASYGFTGNDNFADYTWISRMAQTQVAIGNTSVTSYYPSSVENPLLRWERTKQLNLGADIGLYNNRLLIELDAYESNSDGLLLNVPVPSTSGFTSVFSNIGALRNRGLELSVNSRNITHKDFSWNTHLTYSFNRGKITKLGPNDAPLTLTRTNMSIINQVGEVPFSFFTYEYMGVYKNQAEIDADGLTYPYKIHPGMGKYRDTNGDGVINSEDRKVIGNGQPKFIWGLANSFNYKQFDFSIMVHGSVGGMVYDGNWRRSMFYHEGRNYLKKAVNRWRSESEPGDGYIHALDVDVAGTLEREGSSYWILDGSYLRMKDITLGYTVPVNNLSRFGITKTRVYFNATNLFTLQKTTTIDPENMDSSPDDAAAVGVQFSPYPTAKMFTLGLNVQF